MPPIVSFKELIVWQRSMELARAVYLSTEALPKSEQYGLMSQMRRSVVSIPSNIAEGYKRKGLGEYVYFLSVADASAAELETHILLVCDIYPDMIMKRPPCSVGRGSENANRDDQKVKSKIISSLNA